MSWLLISQDIFYFIHIKNSSEIHLLAELYAPTSIFISNKDYLNKKFKSYSKNQL